MEPTQQELPQDQSHAPTTPSKPPRLDKILIALFIISLVFVLITLITSITTHAANPVRIEFRNDNWNSNPVVFVVMRPEGGALMYNGSYLRPMTLQGDTWVATVRDINPPFTVMFANGYNFNADMYTITGDTAIINGEPHPITSPPIIIDLHGLYYRLDRLHDLLKETAHTITPTLVWQLGLQGFTAGIALVLVIAMIWSRLT